MPPSVIKQHQALQQQKKSQPTPKTPSTGSSKATENKNSANASKFKQDKSIFSNTSESEDEKPPPVKEVRRPSGNPPASRGRGRPRKYPPKEVPNKTILVTPEKPPTSKADSKNSSKTEVKREISSASSTSTDSSSAASTNSESNSESENDAKPSRKSARMNSNRKSKHLITTPVKSESETDDSMFTKRSMVKNSLKKGISLMSTKASKQKKIEQKLNMDFTKDSGSEEKVCPLEGCTSLGHLGGNYEKHFTIEACPFYHNVTINETKQNLIERRKRVEERAKTLKELDLKTLQTTEQKAYLQKIRDLRAKFKPPPKSQTNERANDGEPKLTGVVSEYDLQLFQDAQAIASENVENELTKLSCHGGGLGTKWVIMGKNKMEVWYQSVYPEDVQRLPKLYLCEFCLRYQKSEVGMKRHAAKCVWRHPPGDEIYRKGKLCVWQVDGKRQKVREEGDN